MISPGHMIYRPTSNANGACTTTWRRRRGHDPGACLRSDPWEWCLRNCCAFLPGRLWSDAVDPGMRGPTHPSSKNHGWPPLPQRSPSSGGDDPGRQPGGPRLCRGANSSKKRRGTSMPKHDRLAAMDASGWKFKCGTNSLNDKHVGSDGADVFDNRD